MIGQMNLGCSLEMDGLFTLGEEHEFNIFYNA